LKTKTPFKLSALDETNRLGEIYRAAALLICEKGYDGTSMSDIAEAVGLTKAGVYHQLRHG
jgi:TetR/AcrR family transcriptional regulator, cholesterol catabolism regulator